MEETALVTALKSRIISTSGDDCGEKKQEHLHFMVMQRARAGFSLSNTLFPIPPLSCRAELV